jgi:ribonuclease VapC
MFVDACTMLALIAREPTETDYSFELDRAINPVTSALAVWEAVLVLSRPDQLNCKLTQAEAYLLDWLEERNIQIVEPRSPREILAHAVSAAEKYGVSRRSLSALDCFHYAYAKALEVPVLTLDQALRKTDVTCLP